MAKRRCSKDAELGTTEGMAGERIDLSSEPTTRPPDSKDEGRRFLGVHFACCGVYARAYINREGTAYVARCPRCFGLANFVIGADGSAGRFFSVS